MGVLSLTASKNKGMFFSISHPAVPCCLLPKGSLARGVFIFVREGCRRITNAIEASSEVLG